METQQPKYTKKDFSSPQQVRWCPGCGGYAILSCIQNTLVEMGDTPDNTVFVSGIGCSSRFPYYMSTYGFHSLHGRAAAVATGLKVANPALNVWVVSGDGDSLAIGGNHFIHTIRRNLDINYIIFNNEIYGLTKGQYSPTSKLGLVTKSSPYGTVERTFLPGSLALGCEASFFARTTDTNPKEMTEIFIAAAKHKGTSVVEVLQNCVIFNDKAHLAVTAKETRADNQLILRHGEPLIFGKDRNKGIVFNELGEPKVVTLGENGVTEKDILVHNIHLNNPSRAFRLSRMQLPDFPVALGIFRQVEEPTFEQQIEDQIEQVTAQKGKGDFQRYLETGDVWEVK